MDKVLKVGEKAVITTAVGCLKAFEDHFGEKLKLFSSKEDLTEQERDFVEIANSLRKTIFNIGNNQRRRFIQESSKH
jgi:hypothetical protein